MLLRAVEAENFLVFGNRVRLALGPGLTVVTGPNGAGKTSLGLCLDVAHAVVTLAAGEAGSDGADLYVDAGHDGAESFSVALEIDLDQERERRLVWAFVCAGYACGGADEPPADEADSTCRKWLELSELSPLFSGRLVIWHVSGLMRPWFAAWEFCLGDDVWNVGLTGAGSGQLRRGAADPWAASEGASRMRDWLLTGKPQDRNVIHFGMALRQVSKAVSFSVQPLMGGSATIPQSLRELASGLSVTDVANKGFSLGHVLSAVLHRGLVLTDNRRLPMQARFIGEELAQPAELRDGSGVAAVLYQLKCGDARDQARFGQVQECFRALTRKGLELRVRHLPAHQDGGMMIEPVLVRDGRHRLVAFSGAGAQEALLLSVLLVSAEGKVVVLDEPAVNLEPTVQRRLLRQLRQPGQRIVITHHADLVPVDEPADLERVVRIVAGPSGSEILRPDLGSLKQAELRRLMQVMDPVHVRGLLFAPAVILCEGGTETGALPRWWRAASARLGLDDPESANIPLIDVGGQTRYGGYVQLLDAFKIPWAIVCDGPAIRCDSVMAKQLANLGHHPDSAVSDRDDFAGSHKAWESVGVFTVADQFGDDGSKAGEFEVLLQRTDESLLDSIRHHVGRGGKPIVGSWFATDHPEPPDEVQDLYRKIAQRLHLDSPQLKA